ncbi:MAG TPA: hypothetical protein VFC53_09820 [Dehalococcoidia bacterium]|nr:hypothetical protein [Dehalococcoidia bacterium]
MALVLPKAVVSGVAWGETRDLFRQGYYLEFLISSHDPAKWNFSDNTDLSEVLLIAKKRGPGRKPPDRSARVTCVNLWRNPATAFEALSLAHSIDSDEAPKLEKTQGAQAIEVSGEKVGEAVQIAWSELQTRDWMLGCSFAQAELLRAAYALITTSKVVTPSGEAAIAFKRLGGIGRVGPDRRDIHDGFSESTIRTPYPAYWGHDASECVSLATTPNRYLAPVARAKPGRPLRRVTDLWPKAGRVMLAERMWLHTQRLVSVRLPEAALANVWWPFRLQEEDPEAEKALVLWLNSTLGLITLLSFREETRGAWVAFKKPVLEELPVLDVTTLGKTALRAFADAFDKIAQDQLEPLPRMDSDPVRAAIDVAVSRILKLPVLDVLRNLLAQEPVISLRGLT